jgi:hypothetical protein
MRRTDLTIGSLTLPLKGQKLYYDDTLPSFGRRGDRMKFQGEGISSPFSAVPLSHGHSPRERSRRRSQ